MNYRLLIFCLLLFATSCTKRNAVSEFVEDRDMALSLYFYPSTLRMINIERNPEYDAMIRNVEKARFFKLDSGQVVNVDISKLIAALNNDGFEEVMYVKNKESDIRVLALETEIPEFVILSKSDEEMMLLEITGMINIAKIPKLMQTFNQNGFLDVLSLYGDKNKK